jgi:ElaB/YqjD/DUF883 family membrane-anchored ribosome-binding protein
VETRPEEASMAQEKETGAAKAQLLEDFGQVVADTEALLRSLAGVGGEKAAGLRESVEANLASTKARLLELQAGAAETASAAMREADEYVHEKPWTAIGIAAAVGVIIGVMIGNNRR